MKQTPLNQTHRDLGARMVDFGGWDMPVQYSGVIEEHVAVRQAAGLFDVSHMGEVEVTGPNALAFIQHLTINDAAKLVDGQIQYSALCYPEGGVVDDVTLYRFNESRYLFCVNASNTDKDFAWMQKVLADSAITDVTLTNRSDEFAQLALQGPKAETILTALTDVPLADINAVVKFAFISVGVWWLIFLMPLMLVVRETKSETAEKGGTIRAAYWALKETFLKVRSYRNVFLFLVAYWFYIGGLFTVIFMAVNFGQRLGFSSQDLVKALLITNFVGFPATLGYGYIGHHFGPRNSIFLGLAVYIGVVCWAVFLVDVSQFYAMSITIGMVQGGVQGMSRSLFAGLIPAHQSGKFFGFYNMLTKFAHVLGPVLVGIVAYFSDEPKYILVAVLPMFVIGALMLTRVDGTLADSDAEAKPGGQIV